MKRWIVLSMLGLLVTGCVNPDYRYEDGYYSRSREVPYGYPAAYPYYDVYRTNRAYPVPRRYDDHGRGHGDHRDRSRQHERRDHDRDRRQADHARREHHDRETWRGRSDGERGEGGRNVRLKRVDDHRRGDRRRDGHRSDRRRRD